MLRKSPTALFLVGLTAIVIAGFGARAAFANSKSSTTIGNGILVIEDTLGYQGGSAAGTGMVLTSSGEVLTNNHVINGSTQVVAIVPGTSHHYIAKVVGYSVANDVAVLQLQHASNLKTITTSSKRPAVGLIVHAVGNAGGTGSLTSAYGTISALGKTITASNDEGSSETLRGLLEVSANVQPGDSGGPLLDGDSHVVGMTTAASQGNFGYGYAAASVSPDAYAIPIAKALSVVHLIEAGERSATIHIGATAFMGVEVSSAARYGSSGAIVAGLVPNGPAAKAGLRAGDVITKIGDTTVTSPTAITKIVLSKKPGAKISVTYTRYGERNTLTVTLGSGPPQ
ncbi:MAG TPA: trypsin-like peptidase domain-containing protein [Gaiellaceae bacterium]